MLRRICLITPRLDLCIELSVCKQLNITQEDLEEPWRESDGESSLQELKPETSAAVICHPQAVSHYYPSFLPPLSLPHKSIGLPTYIHVRKKTAVIHMFSSTAYRCFPAFVRITRPTTQAHIFRFKRNRQPSTSMSGGWGWCTVLFTSCDPEQLNNQRL